LCGWAAGSGRVMNEKVASDTPSTPTRPTQPEKLSLPRPPLPLYAVCV